MDPQRDPKRKMLDRIAEDNGVALVVLDEHSREVSVSNNNSICRALTTSSEFAPRCAEYCGVAFGKTVEGVDFEYRCHAGLVCRAVPVIEGEQRFVAIVGRTFTSADSYREATEKAISGEWRRFPANEFFGNVLLDSSNSKIDKAAEALSKFRAPRTPNILDLNAPLPEVKIARPAAKVVQIPKQPAHKVETKDFAAQKRDEEIRQRSDEASAFRSLYERLLNMPYDTACRTVLEFLRSRFELKSVVWLENRDNQLEPAAAIGAFRDMPVRLGVGATNRKLIHAYEKNVPLVLRERPGEAHAGTRTLSLFPCVVAREVRG